MRTSSKACPCVPSMRAYETPERVCVHILRQAVCAQTQGSTRRPAFLQPAQAPPPGRGAPQGPSQLIPTCRPLSSDTHMYSDPSRHAYAYSVPQWCTHTRTHTQSQVSTDPRGRSQLLIHLLIHSEIHPQLHIAHLHRCGPSGQSHVFRSSTVPASLFARRAHRPQRPAHTCVPSFT